MLIRLRGVYEGKDHTFRNYRFSKGELDLTDVPEADKHLRYLQRSLNIEVVPHQTDSNRQSKVSSLFGKRNAGDSPDRRGSELGASGSGHEGTGATDQFGDRREFHQSIRNAVLELDPDNDEFWTRQGLPRIDVVSERVQKEVDRETISTATDRYTRERTG